MERQSEKIENDLDKFEFGINKCKLEDFLSYGTINELSHYLANKGYTKQEWISVEERLPKDYQEVIVYSANIEFNIFTYQGNNEWRNEQGMTFETEDSIITHWMPLPTPPKMKGAE